MQRIDSRSWLIALSLLFCLPSAHALPTVQRWTTPQGSTVLFLENHDLPMLDVQVSFDAGSRRDPANKPGVAGFAAGLLLQGAGGLDEAELARREADLGAQIGPFGGHEAAGVSLRTLSDPAQRQPALQLLATVMARPDYPEAVLNREKARTEAALKQDLTQPGDIANDRFRPMLYGPQQPWGRTIAQSLAALPQITRQDLQQFHREHFVARGAIISLVGDISRAEAEAIATELMAAIPAEGPPLAALPAVEFAAPGQTHREDFPASQAHILLGQPFVSRNDPDYYALLVGNHILGGGGFNSRLMKIVRDQQGLVYGIYSSFQAAQQAGPFVISLQTRKEEADRALKVTRQTVQRFVEEGPTPAELELARKDILNGLAVDLDTNARWLGVLDRMGRYNLPLTYLQDYQAIVRQLTPSQIRDAMRRHLQPEKLVTVIVGQSPESTVHAEK